MPVKANRKCTECGISLVDRKNTAITCGSVCRRKRSRRVQRARKLAVQKRRQTMAGSIEIQQLEELASGVVSDEARAIVRSEIAPVVRGALTEDVMHSIRDLVALGPKMVQAVSVDMESPDSVVRQKAYTLWAKYTLGNPALAPADETKQPMTVVFNGMPRPDTVDAVITPEPAEELRKCTVCAETKLTTEFEQHSDRCAACHRALQERAAGFME